MTDIVAFDAAHVPAVAALFQKTFRNRSRPAVTGLSADLTELFLDHPERDAEMPSRVWLRPDGRVGGFIGVVPLRMAFRGRTIRAAVPSSLMVDEPDRHPLVGARLVRSFLAGPQDISISEPINDRARPLWLRLGGQVPISESMEWLKVLRPAGLGLALVADRYPAALALRGAAALADRLARAFVTGAPERRTVHDAHADDADLLAFFSDPASDYALHPAWTAPTFGWMLAHAAGNRSRGQLIKRVVFDASGAPIGCYLYQGARGRIAFVLHVQTRRDTAGAVLDALFAHAAGLGCVAVKGRTQARLLEPLLTRDCILFRRHGAMVHSRDPHLLSAIHAGEAVTGGLAGESWMRPVSERPN